LAAFFRADFTVGFFLAAFRAAGRRADLVRAAVFRAGFLVSFFFFAGDFLAALAAFFARADFFLVAIRPPLWTP
jgi:hypothetical protein